MNDLIIIGGGLAGSEAAWQAAKYGVKVILYEMRPEKGTPVHKTSSLAELVCSNSFGSISPEKPAGLLKKELQLLGSFVLNCAERNKLPAGSSLSVDREAFSYEITRCIENNPNIRVIRSEVKEIPDAPCIIATGPLTSDALAEKIRDFTGVHHLYFYDAIAPLVLKDGIDFSIAFYASRYGVGEKPDGDYINCPLTRNEYDVFANELCAARRIPLENFEGESKYFEACLPVEVLAQRSRLALAYGPMRPVGIFFPNSSRTPYAIVQLRQDNLADSLYNMVGFQTNLAYSEQERVFHMIPGLKNATFLQFGQMHRNTYICSPKILLPTLQTKKKADLFFAGQIAGLEGYLGSIASGLVAGINAARLLKGEQTLSFPLTTMVGALCNYISHADVEHFQPMKANLGLLPEFSYVISPKIERGYQKYLRAMNDMQDFIHKNHPI